MYVPGPCCYSGAKKPVQPVEVLAKMLVEQAAMHQEKAAVYQDQLNLVQGQSKRQTTVLEDLVV